MAVAYKAATNVMQKVINPICSRMDEQLRNDFLHQLCLQMLIKLSKELKDDKFVDYLLDEYKQKLRGE